MLTRENLCTLWLLLLLHVSGSAIKFNMFRSIPRPREGDIRLFGSERDSEGRVEVYHDGKWGTVCDDGWDMAEAQVVCRQLHFPGAKSVVIGQDYGTAATGPIWLDDINCNGTESHLFSCGFKNWGVSDCSHKEDVGIICETGNDNVTISDSKHSLDHTFSLSDDLGQIFDSGNGCDFLIIVRSPTGNKQEDGDMEMMDTTICAHKMILSQFPLFSASEGNANITVDVSQACEPHFTSFIRYIYTRKIDVAFSSVQCLHWMASKFGVKQLTEEAGRLLSKVLPEDDSFRTQLSIYKYAEEAGDSTLQENCVQYLAWNYQNLTRSPVWSDLSVELIGTLLTRSDLVVPDEYFLLQTVESWITEKSDSINSDTQVHLLSQIRFPMIPVEKLYELESSSSLYSTDNKLYQEKMLKAFQFNVLLYSNLLSNPKFKHDHDYLPRIYTATPWSVSINPLSASPQQGSSHMRNRNAYGSGRHRYDRYDYHIYPSVHHTATQSFSTPVHNSLIFKENKVYWEANVFKSKSECSNRAVACDSLPMAKLVHQSQPSTQSTIRFQNRLLLLCQGKYICQVQDFKDNLAYIASNNTKLAYPCPDNQFTYHFVIRPEYV
ncbi:galectin-3-binding protein A [Echeneis naucrates]|uniref:SRCR domain-containing protein n=1 Tax=Echeneis naucrates TaxID=173247 RepID=A0A665VLQ4_ECHNA|nr:galectin-3-binding protein [Echeneis naucrates]